MSPLSVALIDLLQGCHSSVIYAKLVDKNDDIALWDDSLKLERDMSGLVNLVHM